MNDTPTAGSRKIDRGEAEGAPERDGGTASRVSTLQRGIGQTSVKVGLALTLLVVLIALIGPYFSPYSPTEFIGMPNSAAGTVGMFGTDSLGRDVLSRTLHGGRLLLLLTLISTIIGVGIGSTVGVVAAYFRGWVDEGIMRTMDILLAFPYLVLALLFLAMLGAKLWLLTLLVAGGHIPRVARVVRGSAISVVEKDFIQFARSVGSSTRRILLREVVPNISGTLSVEFGLRFTFSIGALAGLSFLGLGVQPPQADWGLMINENRSALTAQPWSVALPVIAIGVLTIGTNLMANGFARSISGADADVE